MRSSTLVCTSSMDWMLRSICSASSMVMLSRSRSLLAICSRRRLASSMQAATTMTAIRSALAAMMSRNGCESHTEAGASGSAARGRASAADRFPPSSQCFEQVKGGTAHAV